MPRRVPMVLCALLCIAGDANPETASPSHPALDPALDLSLESDDGISIGGFTNVEGLDMETAVVEYGDGEDVVLRSRPSRASVDSARGVTLREFETRNDRVVTEWWEACAAGNADCARNVALLLAVTKPTPTLTKGHACRIDLIGARPAGPPEGQLTVNFDRISYGRCTRLRQLPSDREPIPAPPGPDEDG